MKNNILLIDFDSTFVQVESLDELAAIVLRGKTDKRRILQEIMKLTRLGMEGKLTFPESLQKRLLLFKPHEKDIDQLILLLKERVTVSIERNRKFFNENAEKIYILSGGFKEYMVPVLREFGINENHILGNTFRFNSEGFVVGFDKENPLAQEKGKVKMIEKMNFKNALIIVGDGYTDYEIKKAGIAKKFIAFTENVERETILQKADVIVRNFEEVIQIV